MKAYWLPLLLTFSLTACAGKSKPAPVSTSAVSSTETPEQTFLENQEMSLDLSYGKRDGVYTGQVKSGLPHGEGTFISSSKDGVKWTFRGSWVNGHYNGYGFTVWDSGQMEMGIYENDELKRDGITISADGKVYRNSKSLENIPTIESTPKSTPVNVSEPVNVSLLDSGWCSYKNSSYTHVPYAVQITNPNQEYAIKYPTIIITARSEAGKILKTDDRVFHSIAAGDTIFYGDEIFYEGEEPATVEISVENGKEDFEKQDDYTYLKQSDFEIFNTSENSGNSKIFTGEIKNNSGVDLEKATIIVIYKQEGKLVGGDITFVDDLAAGSSKPFELLADSDMNQYDSYEFYALQ